MTATRHAARRRRVFRDGMLGILTAAAVAVLTLSACTAGDSDDDVTYAQELSTAQDGATTGDGEGDGDGTDGERETGTSADDGATTGDGEGDEDSTTSEAQQWREEFEAEFWADEETAALRACLPEDFSPGDMLDGVLRRLGTTAEEMAAMSDSERQEKLGDDGAALFAAFFTELTSANEDLMSCLILAGMEEAFSSTAEPSDEDSSDEDSSDEEPPAWEFGSGENTEGGFDYATLTSTSSSASSWDAEPVLAVRCGSGVSGVNDAVMLATPFYIPNDYDQDLSSIKWRISPAMEQPEREDDWWSNEEFNSTLFGETDSPLVQELRSTQSGTLYVTVIPGSDVGDTESATFDIEGAADALKKLSCL